MDVVSSTHVECIRVWYHVLVITTSHLQQLQLAFSAHLDSHFRHLQ